MVVVDEFAAKEPAVMLMDSRPLMQAARDILTTLAAWGFAYSVRVAGPSRVTFRTRRRCGGLSLLTTKYLLLEIQYAIINYESRGDRGFDGENISNAQPHASSAGTTRCPGS